jgi:hypothetical protein
MGVHKPHWVLEFTNWKKANFNSLSMGNQNENKNQEVLLDNPQGELNCL